MLFISNRLHFKINVVPNMKYDFFFLSPVQLVFLVNRVLKDFTIKMEIQKMFISPCHKKVNTSQKKALPEPNSISSLAKKFDRK